MAASAASMRAWAALAPSTMISTHPRCSPSFVEAAMAACSLRSCAVTLVLIEGQSIARRESGDPSNSSPAFHGRSWAVRCPLHRN